MEIVLGSSSKWRKEVLRSMGYTFTTMSPDIDEKAIRDADPHILTLKIARAKAEALLYVILFFLLVLDPNLQLLVF